MRSSMWGSAAAALVLVVCSGAAAQEGESPEIRSARAHFARAEQHFEREEYAQSIVEFEAVYETLSSVGHPNAPVVLHNIALCYQRLGRNREAIDAYERFLAEAPSGAPNLDVARGELQELRARVALDEDDESEEAPEVAAQRGGSISPIGPIVAGAGAAIVIAGVITGGLALAANADATVGCVDGHCPPELAPRADEAQLLANVTDGLLFGGLAVAAAGVVLIFVLPGDGGTTASAACTGDGCAAVVRGRF